MSSYTRAFALLSATDQDNIPIPQRGVHYAPTEDDIPRYDAVQWWNPRFENGYTYVQMEYGYMEMEIDVEAVWEDLVTVGQRALHGVQVRWTQRDWQLISSAFDSLRAGYYFSARFLIPNFDCTDFMPFWSFLLQYYRQMLLLGHEHIENGVRVEEDAELYRILVDADGREVIDLTGDASTAPTEPLTDVEDWEIP